ncbi:MAG: 2-polyprenyl-3-methyl-6-methoxy-1,4-benzoquinone monooxygenase [Gammaproteobacteria bacterium]|nr:demethoxyubiquinone hydroxylase family protein [Gammaproteobacteria bacterium]
MTTKLTVQDLLIAAVDEGLRTLTATAPSSRPNPARTVEDAPLTSDEKRLSAALMRVNHAGEIAAQALYAGQSIGARSTATREQLLNAAREERDHLVWCKARLDELGDRPSALGPFWYAGSFCIGLVAGCFGDELSLGFVAETERQVEAHLDDHMGRLPAADEKSRAILREMAADEAHHGTTARLAGGRPLPGPVRMLMTLGGEILRRTAYYV